MVWRCRWLAGAEVLELAAMEDFPPCLVMRQLLKNLPLALSKQVRLAGGFIIQRQCLPCRVGIIVEVT